jgi:hypothetical protein
VFIYFFLNPSKHNTNEICIITFNGAQLHVSASGSRQQAKYNKPIANYRIACYILSALELDSIYIYNNVRHGNIQLQKIKVLKLK